MSINGGYGSSSSGNSVTAGGGYSQGKVDRAWVNNQSGLVATDQANIKADKIENKGALLGSLADNQTNIDTNNPIVYEDIHNYDNSEQRGASAQLSVGSQFTSSGQSTNSGSSGQKSLTLSMQNQSSESKQTSYATIGTGSIKVNGIEQTADQLKGLNRDMSNTTSATTSQITHALNAKVDLDLRFFTKDGRASIANDFNNFGGNILHVSEGITQWGKFVCEVGVGLYKFAGGDSEALTALEAGAKGISTNLKMDATTASDKDKEALKSIRDNNSVNLGWTADALSTYGDYMGYDGAINLYTDGKSFNDGTDMTLNMVQDSKGVFSDFTHELMHVAYGVQSEDAANFGSRIMTDAMSISNFFGGSSFSTESGVMRFIDESNPASNINMSMLLAGNAKAALVPEDQRQYSLTGAGEMARLGTGKITALFGININGDTAKEQSAAQKAFGAATGATSASADNLVNKLYGLQNVPQESANLPNDINEVKKDIKTTAGEMKTSLSTAEGRQQLLDSAVSNMNVAKTAEGTYNSLTAMSIIFAQNPGLLGDAGVNLGMNTIISTDLYAKGLNNSNMIYGALTIMGAGLVDTVGALGKEVKALEESAEIAKSFTEGAKTVKGFEATGKATIEEVAKITINGQEVTAADLASAIAGNGAVTNKSLMVLTDLPYNGASTMPKMTDAEVELAAIRSTFNPGSNQLVLGKYIDDTNPASYQNVAKEMKATYFQLPDDLPYNNLYPGDFQKIDSAFVNQQLKISGKEILTSHTPFNQTGGFGLEISTMKDEAGIVEYKQIYNDSLKRYLWKANK